MIKALVLDRHNNTVTSSIRDIQESDLPEGDVLVKVLFSSLNYKDALAVTGSGKVIRGAYPFVPGIDLVGTVLASESPVYEEGDTVIVTGYGIGENSWGGYTQVERVHSDWLVPLPEGMTPLEAMAIGTAGLTAMLAVMALENSGVNPSQGEVVVTGASGGVGSFSVYLLASRGYKVVAATGSETVHDYLRFLGASRIIHRNELGRATKPLESARWAGAVDTVGGETLANIIASLQRHASAAVCGNAGGDNELHTTVFPFILRGVNLLGIDSNTAEHNTRIKAWDTLAALLRHEVIAEMAATVPLSRVPEKCDEILRGEITGRIVVDVNEL